MGFNSVFKGLITYDFFFLLFFLMTSYTLPSWRDRLSTIDYVHCLNMLPHSHIGLHTSYVGWHFSGAVGNFHNCLLERVIEGKIDVAGRRRRRRKQPAAGWPLGRENILELERWRTRLHAAENSFWKGLWNCRKTDYVINRYKNIFYVFGVIYIYQYTLGSNFCPRHIIFASFYFAIPMFSRKEREVLVWSDPSSANILLSFIVKMAASTSQIWCLKITGNTK